MGPLRLLGWALIILVPLAALSIGLLYVKLAFGDLPLRFLVEPIKQALQGELDGANIGIDDAVLQRGQTAGFELRLKGLRLTAPGDGGVARADEANLELDGEALWRGKLAASRIVLLKPRFVMVSDEAAAAQSAASALKPAIVPEAGSRPPPATAGSNSSPDQAQVRPAQVQPAQVRPAQVRPAQVRPGREAELVRLLATTVAQMRRGGDASSHLKSLGIRDGAVVIESDGQRSLLAVPELDIDLDHRQKRSFISGKGRLAAGGEPFSVTFRLEQSEKDKRLRLETRLESLSPRALARSWPALGFLAPFDVPLTAQGSVDLGDAHVASAQFEIDLGRGRMLLSTLGGLPLGIDGGRLGLVYDGATRATRLAPSTIRLDGSWLKVAGGLLPVRSASGEHGWQLGLEASDGALVGDRNAPPLPIERLTVTGKHWPATGATELAKLSFKAGGAELEASGSIPGAGSTAASALTGRLGPMSIETFKAVWPAALAPELRAAVGERLLKGELKAGQFSVAGSGVPPAAASSGDAASVRAGGRLSLSVEGHDLEVAVMAGAPPLQVPRALLRVADNNLEITIPDAFLNAGGGRRLGIKQSRIAVQGIDRPNPIADIVGRGQGPLAALLDIARRPPHELVKPDLVPPGTDGKLEGQWHLQVPVASAGSADGVRLDGKVRITELRIPDVMGKHDITGGAFTIAASEKAVDVKGEMLLAGIHAKASGQWFLGEAADKQPPLTLSARLDDADRRQLGLDELNDHIHGEVPLEITLRPGEGEQRRVQVNADLTAAELSLNGISWRKPAGREAKLAFDVVRLPAKKGTELQGFRLTGDSLTIEGMVTLGPDDRPIAYRFPGFSLNVVSNLTVEGQRRANGVWDVKAHGKTFDGGDIMRSLYMVDAVRKRPEKRPTSMDLSARVETVLGHNDGTLRNVELELQRRNDEITGLKLSGALDGGAALTAVMRPAPGQARVVEIETADAGQALKTIGFYSSMLGGKGQLAVNLDGRGAAEKAGQLKVSRYRILGDPIVSELIQGADETRPAIASSSGSRPKRVVREEIQFDSLRANFATGNGQVAMESLAAAGPLMGISVRGKLDFRSQRMTLGGTYVPLSGLNRALSGIPLFGELLTGPRGEGVFGLTFAVDGPMAQPQVIVNPFSIVAPGLLREIFQMAPLNPSVTPAAAPERAPAPAPKLRSSPPAATKAQGGAGPQPQLLDGWSSQSTPSPAGR